jgi:hypothetical protein
MPHDARKNLAAALPIQPKEQELPALDAQSMTLASPQSAPSISLEKNTVETCGYNPY